MEVLLAMKFYVGKRLFYEMYLWRNFPQQPNWRSMKLTITLSSPMGGWKNSKGGTTYLSEFS